MPLSASHLRHANVRAHARGPDGREEQEGAEERLFRVAGRREKAAFGLAEGEDGEGGETEEAEVGLAGLGKVGGRFPCFISPEFHQETMEINFSGRAWPIS